MIDCCRKITGHKIPVVEKPRRPGDPPRLIAASEKIKTRTGLAAAIPIARCDHRERLEMAPEISERLRGLSLPAPSRALIRTAPRALQAVDSGTKRKRPRKHVPRALSNFIRNYD